MNERGPPASPFEINWHFQKTFHARLHALFPGVPRFTRVYVHDAPLLPSPSTLLSSFCAATGAQKRLDAGILCFLSWKHLGQIFWLARIHRCYATISVNGHRCYPPILRRIQRFLYLYKLEIYKTKGNIQNIESKLLVTIFRMWNKFATCACKTILRKYPQSINNFQKRQNPGGLFYGRSS